MNFKRFVLFGYPPVDLFHLEIEISIGCNASSLFFIMVLYFASQNRNAMVAVYFILHFDLYLFSLPLFIVFECFSKRQQKMQSLTKWKAIKEHFIPLQVFTACSEHSKTMFLCFVRTYPTPWLLLTLLLLCLSVLTINIIRQ